jgi:hypothetical protein
MARIRYGSLVQDISGSIGSSTFQKNLYGNTLRSRPRAQKTGSQAQLLQRTYLVQAQNAWRSLSEIQRKQWNDYISFSGSSIKRDSGILTTGHALFIKYHVFRFMVGLPVLGNLYYQAMPVHANFVGIVSDGYTPLLTFSDIIVVGDTRFIFRAGPLQTNPGAFNPRGLRFMPLAWADTDQFDFAASYLAAFGKRVQDGASISFSIQFFSCYAPVIDRPQFYNQPIGSY